jgi:predicted nucleic acid-binding protein
VIVIADTTPLLYLADLGLLDVFPRLFGAVRVPSEVWKELVLNEPHPAREAQLRAATWLHIDPSVDASPPLPGLQRVHPGEAAAIALALHLGGDLVLMDDRDGRQEARQRGLKVRGTIGVLTAARVAGFIGPLSPIFATLRAAGFRADPGLYADALAEVNETA